MVVSVSAQVKVFIDNNLSPAANRKRLVDTAILARERLIADGQASKIYQTYVDGNAQANEANAQHVIRYKFDYMKVAVQDALAKLISMAPVAGPTGNRKKTPGSYRDSFMISNGAAAFPAAQFNFDTLENGVTILIYNNQPYGRKVDTRTIGNKEMSFSSGEKFLFAKTASYMRSKYGQGVAVQRLYSVTVAGQWVRTTGKKRGGVGRLVEYPALEITINR